MRPKLLICGAAGRMGRRIVALAAESKNFDIIGATEQAGHPDLGRDAGLLAGIGELGVKLDKTCESKADVVIDFSQPQAAETTIEYCLTNKAALVIGTTGLSDAQQAKLKDASKSIPILYATNMSVGMNLLFGLVGKVAKMLGDNYDIEIVEQHHRHKKDSPSGSALTLAENICKDTDKDFPASLVHGREGKDTIRQKGTIGMHAVRAGDITGVHTIIYGTEGESIEITHRASNRDTFVRGALRAAKWLTKQNCGLYSMADALKS
ncbi:MAG: 4-hydroxy-tetrahydrodipicolinate reductase [Phycisphaerae bacterium]|nr:4-hydroxy-tetrahydrodipicolinate reductase [Phycisphaerae bacterium]